VLSFTDLEQWHELIPGSYLDTFYTRLNLLICYGCTTNKRNETFSQPQKLSKLSDERDAAFDRAEEAEKQLKALKLDFAKVEQENHSLTAKVDKLEAELEETTHTADDLKKK
jgi:septal ring factor EnvC (AmiA/AmiB activator)